MEPEVGPTLRTPLGRPARHGRPQAYRCSSVHTHLAETGQSNFMIQSKIHSGPVFRRHEVPSCMTLFDLAAPQEAVFGEALQQYFDGMPNDRTRALRLLGWTSTKK